MNFKTPLEYKSKNPLTAKIYDQVYIEEKDRIIRDLDGNVVEGAKSSIGKTITITSKEEMIDLLEKKDTPIIPASPKEQIFADVAADHWAYKNIVNFYYANILRGIGNGLFAPDDQITEEHFAFLLQRLFGYKETRTAQIPAIRQNIITSLVKASKIENSAIKNDNILNDKFKDSQLISQENGRYIKIAVENGLVMGSDDGLLHADSELTRAEAITLLSRGIAKVYGIAEEDRPELYKFKIQPKKNAYIEVSSESPVEFWIPNEETLWIQNRGTYDLLIRDKDRLSGKVLFTFGDDGVNDTKVIAVCIADEDVYTIETISFDALRFNPVIALDAVVNIYKNGLVYRLNQGLRIVVEEEEDLIYIGIGRTKLLFDNINISKGKMPMPPSRQPYEEYEAQWGNGKYIVASEMGLFKGNVIEIGFNDFISGYMKIQYNNQENNIMITSQILVDDQVGIQNAYQFEVVEIKSITDSEAEGLFNIICNGEIVVEKILAKFIGINAELGGKMNFISDDGVWDLEIYVTEKGN